MWLRRLRRMVNVFLAKSEIKLTYQCCSDSSKNSVRLSKEAQCVCTDCILWKLDHSMRDPLTTSIGVIKIIREEKLSGESKLLLKIMQQKLQYADDALKELATEINMVSKR